MLVFGLVAALVCGVTWSWVYAPVIGWATACLSYVTWVWGLVWRMSPAQTKQHAQQEAPALPLMDLLLLLASALSLVDLVFVLARARNSEGATQQALALLAVVSVALSWLLVHTLYTLRYARLFYGVGGGVDFNQDEPPSYKDFAYLSFTLGMTYQVSDTNISEPTIRQTVLKHTLLSYVFGAIILASVVNLIGGLIV